MRQVVLLVVCLFPFLIACEAQTRPRVSAERLLFEDNFAPGEGGVWRLEGDEVAYATIAEGQLVIEVQAPETVHYVTLEQEVFGDFVLEIDARMLDGHPENSYGVLFRMASPEQFYRFEITGSGLYIIERRDANATWTRLSAGWSESAAIKPGIGATNRMRISATGSQLNFAVNGVHLTQLEDPTYTSGNVALDAGTFARAGVRVAFDNLLIARP